MDGRAVGRGKPDLYLWARDWVPPCIENWATGTQGERSTARVLKGLPGEWAVFHDIEVAKGNWDHVVIGPRGVFLLESKNLGGRVTVDGEGLTVVRRHDPKSGYHLRNVAARSQYAVALKKAIRDVTKNAYLGATGGCDQGRLRTGRECRWLGSLCRWP